MGRLITNPAKPVVRVNVTMLNFRKLAALAQRVHDFMLTNVAIFVLPLPTSVNFQTAITALYAEIGLLGTKSNKGSVAQLNATKAAAFTVYAMLDLRAAYVQEVVDGATNPPAQAVIVSKSGFAAKSKKSRIPKMQFVTGVRQSNNKQFPQTVRRVDWKKSLGLFKGAKIKSYNIVAHNDATNSSQYLTSTTATNILVPPSFEDVGGTKNITAITVYPMGAAGQGNGFRIDVK